MKKRKVLEIPYRRIVARNLDSKDERYYTRHLKLLTKKFCCDAFSLLVEKGYLHLMETKYNSGEGYMCLDIRMHWSDNAKFNVKWCPFCGAKLKLIKKNAKLSIRKEREITTNEVYYVYKDFPDGD